MDLPPRIEDIPCPTCHAPALKAREEGLGAECTACGQYVIFDEDASAAGKRRNYTPERNLKKMLGDTPPVEPHEPSHLPDGPARDFGKALPADHRGPLPVVKSIEDARLPVAASHALETVQREHWKKSAALAVALALLAGASIWAWRENKLARAAALDAPPPATASLPANRVLVEGAATPADDADVNDARIFLNERILPAAKWEDWLPHIRLPGEVEPLLRSYYAEREFQPLQDRAIRSVKFTRNAAGKFAVFLLDHPVYQIAMVELSPDGPRLDWEMLVNLPLRDWEKFTRSRPSAPTNLAVAMSRCYVREDYLTAAELPNRADQIGVRLGMPGNPELLFATLPLASPLGQWLADRLPWEHENRTLLCRATLNFTPEFEAMKDRVVLLGEPTPGWNRIHPATPATNNP